MDKILPFGLDKVLYEKIRVEAYRKKISKAEVVRKALTKYFSE